MKNFKKILMLTALVSAISGTALGATYTNPGDSVEGLTNGQKASAGVPMEVRVNIIGQGPELVLVDEANNMIETLMFDHGNKVLAENNGKQVILNESKVEKIVIMKRTDGKAFNANSSGTDAKITGYTANFSVENSIGYDAESHTLKLVKLNSGSDGEKFINTALDFLDHDITVDKGATEVRTTVVSIIPQRTEAESGLYIGTGTFVGTLTAQATE